MEELVGKGRKKESKKTLRSKIKSKNICNEKNEISYLMNRQGKRRFTGFERRERRKRE